VQFLENIFNNGLKVLGLSFLIISSAMAIEYNESATESEKIESIKYLAEQGVAEWQAVLATRYKYGWGVPKDRVKYLYWLNKAIDQNYVFAQLEMGEIYEVGDFVRQDKSMAKEWYGKACDGGYVYGCQSYRRLNELGY